MARLNGPVTLSAERVDELNRKFSRLRHEINNHLSVTMVAIELMRMKPQMAERMMSTLVEQCSKIAGSLDGISAQVEQTVGVVRPKPAEARHQDGVAANLACGD